MDDEFGELESPRPKGGGVRRVLFWLLFLTALGGSAYWAAEWNHRRLFLAVSGDRVMVQQGRRLPFGRAPIEVTEAEKARAYAEIRLPRGMDLPQGSTEYPNARELEAGLFRVLAEAAEHILRAQPEGGSPLLEAYFQQAEALTLAPNETQRLDALRASAKFLEVTTHLRAGLERLGRVAALLGSMPADPDAEIWARAVQRAMSSLRNLPIPGLHRRGALEVRTATVPAQAAALDEAED